ncbi:PAAR domain-containing protein [Halopseudomonas bauzanensis]|uniref:Zn-binding Pro-Ala-Ala-Arg (PAAR) domain-containing protein, incolved in TypeVI secretion n=1 Tax=Halopseudomonas bauzanensis TaxID=653930 RepID=A0A1I4LYC6_9GAMM|nr:PAAR domain-containing protein [Halopseudomonas bauzanensis]SER84031.1 Zn-binding Pro-Ala-Ala-Arg (PAAR) domain-containing protein, incolved in TypeVI secretion [Halopseudomonas bauzanensis]SFL95843.1 Zn-binding Pro-Ala-Ala-Arg (PAAR) domain-containing protein, incolved in TypeVI secretion [Halopseudomonas bauzanensis]
MIKIGVGSKTSTGGTVIEGNPGIMFDGLVASSVGHQASCPACRKGIGPIMAVGPRTVVLPAGPAARAGDYVACGCPAGSNTLLADGTVHIGSRASGGTAAGAFLFNNTVVHKSIDRIYWSYSESQAPISDTSRFYIDLNLHAETTGYELGETVEIHLQGPLDKTVTGTVQADGTVFIPEVLKNQHLDLQGVL